MLDTSETDRFAVAQVARPVAVLDVDVGAVLAGELAGAALLAAALPLAEVDGADDDADEPLPEDAQPAISPAAASSVTPPNPARKRFVIIAIPFVLARTCSRQPPGPTAGPSRAVTQCSVQALIY
jgi:hypothetical protein